MDLKSLLALSSMFGDLWETKRIDKAKELARFHSYCLSEYKFVPKMENYNLEKLLVVFRHGARAPIRNISRQWRTQRCMGCGFKEGAISGCREKECSDGDLTYMGFEQMKALGGFIREKYKPLLFDNKIKKSNIKMRVTKIPRTHASLAGVVMGLTGDTILEDVKMPEESDSLAMGLGAVVPRCKGENISSFSSSMITRDNEAFKTHSRPQERADHYYTSMCSGVNVDCKELNCEVDNVFEHMRAANENWTKLADLAAKDEDSRRSVFGIFARDLLFDIGEDREMLLYSAHDSSLTAILAGLNTGITEWPSYASALFVEIWCKTGKQYVRLVLNNRVIKPRTFSANYIPIREFIRLLGDMASSVPRSDKNRGIWPIEEHDAEESKTLVRKNRRCK